MVRVYVVTGYENWLLGTSKGRYRHYQALGFAFGKDRVVTRRVAKQFSELITGKECW